MRIITGKARGLKLTTPKNWDDGGPREGIAV